MPSLQYPPYDITLSTKISEVIKEYDLDVLHMHYAVPSCSLWDFSTSNVWKRY